MKTIIVIFLCFIFSGCEHFVPKVIGVFVENKSNEDVYFVIGLEVVGNEYHPTTQLPNDEQRKVLVKAGKHLPIDYSPVKSVRCSDEYAKPPIPLDIKQDVEYLLLQEGNTTAYMRLDNDRRRFYVEIVFNDPADLIMGHLIFCGYFNQVGSTMLFTDIQTGTQMTATSVDEFMEFKKAPYLMKRARWEKLDRARFYGKWTEKIVDYEEFTQKRLTQYEKMEDITSDVLLYDFAYWYVKHKQIRRPELSYIYHHDSSATLLLHWDFSFTFHMGDLVICRGHWSRDRNILKLEDTDSGNTYYAIIHSTYIEGVPLPFHGQIFTRQ